MRDDSTTSRHVEGFQPLQEADLDAIGRAVGVKPLASLDEVALDVWESDDELDAFLRDLRASRQLGLS